MGLKLRNGGGGITPVCELAAFDFWDLLVFVGFDTAVGGRGRTEVGGLGWRPAMGGPAAAGGGVAGTARSFWRQVFCGDPRKHWTFALPSKVSASRSTETSQQAASFPDSRSQDRWPQLRLARSSLEKRDGCEPDARGSDRRRRGRLRYAASVVWQH